MATLPEQFNGSFKFEKNEHFDEYLEKRGVPWLIRNVAKLSKPTKVFSKNDDGSYTLENKSMKTTKWTFKIGEPFEDLGFDGKKHRITFSVDGEKLLEHHVFLEENNEEETFTYELENDLLVQLLKVGDVVAKRTFKKIA